MKKKENIEILQFSYNWTKFVTNLLTKYLQDHFEFHSLIFRNIFLGFVYINALNYKV